MVRIPPVRNSHSGAVDVRPLFALLCVEAIALFMLRLAGTLQFNNFAFFDSGANLTVQYLIGQGLRPGIDFAYHYGLLPLLIGRAWFGVLGLHPFALIAFIPVIDLVIVWGMTRFAANLKLNFAGQLMLVLGGPLIIPSGLLNLTHVIEPALLIHALADQAGGNRRRALVLATVCIFVKPSMAFFMGFLLLVFVVTSALRSPIGLVRATAENSYPAAIAGALTAVIVAYEFGAAALARSVFPTEGAAMYRAQGAGFFNGAGRAFLAPPGVPWTYYFANPAGFWILFTAVLVAAAAIVVRRGLATTGDHSETDYTGELIFSCAFLHLSFVGFFFGSELTWFYYLYIPILGLAAASRLGRVWSYLVFGLAFAFPLSKAGKAVITHLAPAQSPSTAAIGGTQSTPSIGTAQAAEKINAALPTEPGFTLALWRSTSRSPITAGLWAAPDEIAEWREVITAVRGHRAAILAYFGCADLLFAEFLPPVSVYLVLGNANQAEIARKIAQLNSVEMIVMPRWQLGLLAEQPAIGALVRHDFRVTHEGASIVVFTRATNGVIGEADGAAVATAPAASPQRR
jgi:hypothetical protein